LSEISVGISNLFYPVVFLIPINPLSTLNGRYVMEEELNVEQVLYGQLGHAGRVDREKAKAKLILR
jgi:hypothetical protein